MGRARVEMVAITGGGTSRHLNIAKVVVVRLNRQRLIIMDCKEL